MKGILSEYTILYAEDDKNLQASVVEYLDKYFRRVYVADDGLQALESYTTFQPDAMIVDIDMPKLNGLSVVQKIREINKNIPIVVLTALTHTDKLLHATELHLCKYLVKPVEPRVFKETIQKILIKLSNLKTSKIKLGESHIWNIETRQLCMGERIIDLTQKEKDLLSLLASKHQECVTFEEIIFHVWGEDSYLDISRQSVKFQLTFLRKKLPENSIRNIYGQGYMLI